MSRLTRILLTALTALVFNAPAAASTTAPPTAAVAPPAAAIAPWTPRFGRTRAVVAVVAENAGAVVSDYVIPYAVLARSGSADVLSLATRAGPLKLGPLTIDPAHSIDTFDRQYPDGADYVVVPAMVKRQDTVLLDWLRAQAARGATMVSICNGSVVLAEAGLTRGLKVTGHWSSDRKRRRQFPDTAWVKNTRYVADARVVSSAGISAAIPVSLALVEAIGGTARAQALAGEMGLEHWSAQHNSDAFSLTAADGLAAAASMLRASQDVGLPLASGIDDISLALTAEAYTASQRSRVHAVADSAAPVRTRSGLMVIPARVAGNGKPFDLMLPAFDATPSGRMPERLLAEIGARYGKAAARFVMLEWEYPQAAR